MQQLLIRSDPDPSRGLSDLAQGWHVTPAPRPHTTMCACSKLPRTHIHEMYTQCPHRTKLPDARSDGVQQDMSFLPEHYTAVPRQCFYHTVTYLNKVDAGNAALMVVPRPRPLPVM